MSNKIGLDHYRVTRDEAFELMCHHLKLAAMYFEGSPVEIDMDEYERLMKGEVPDHDDPAAIAGRAWLQAIHRVYREMEDRD